MAKENTQTKPSMGKRKISVRLLPTTLQGLRDAAEKHGFDDQISLYVERMLGEKLPLIQALSAILGEASLATGEARVTQTLKISWAIHDKLALESIRLKVRSISDIYEAALLLALGPIETERKISDFFTVKLSDDGKTLRIGPVNGADKNQPTKGNNA